MIKDFEAMDWSKEYTYKDRKIERYTLATRLRSISYALFTRVEREVLN